MTEKFFLLMNFAACIGVAWASFCRLNASSFRVRKLDRVKYVLLMVGGAASAFQGPLFGERPGVADVLQSYAIFVYVLMGVRRWHDGPPESSSMPLDEAQP